MISVCMATYNGEKYIKKQIESILIQLNSDDELIISDDGSTDNTIKIINSFNDNRIRLYFFNSHCYTKNFENALNHANGEYIFLSDQDDIWYSNKVYCIKEYLKKYDLVICNASIIDRHGKIIIESRNRELNLKNGFIRNIIKTHYLGCCFAFNRKVLKSVLPFPKNHNFALHDAWIALYSEFHFKTYICSDVLMGYRRHDENTSNGGAKGINNPLSKIILIRLYLLINILFRKPIS